MEEIENYIQEEEFNEKPKKTEKSSQGKLTIGIILLLIIILLIISVYLFNYFTNVNSKPEENTRIIPTIPVTSPTPTFAPSQWAADSGIIKIENDIKQIEVNLNSLDLNKADLNFPSLDFNINFDKPR